MFKAKRMTNCEMFAMSKTDQGLMSRIHKDLLMINKKKIRNTLEKYVREIPALISRKKSWSRTLIVSLGSWASPGGRAGYSDWGLLLQPCG